MSEYNRHKWAMEWMHGGGRDPHGRGLDEEIRIGKEDWMERQRVAAGGRIGLQSGQLVQPGPGRQGYNGNVWKNRQRKEARRKGLVWDAETKEMRLPKEKPGSVKSPETLKIYNSKEFQKMFKEQLSDPDFSWRERWWNTC